MAASPTITQATTIPARAPVERPVEELTSLLLEASALGASEFVLVGPAVAVVGSDVAVCEPEPDVPQLHPVAHSLKAGL